MSSSLVVVVDGEGFLEIQRMKETELLWRGIDGKDAKFREGKRREGEEVVEEAIDDELIKIKITVPPKP